MAIIDELILRVSIQNDASSAFQSLFGNARTLGDEVEDASGRGIDAFGAFEGAVAGFAQTLISTGLEAVKRFVMESIEEFADFEWAMVGIQRVAHLSTPEVKELGDAFRKLAVTDLKGISKAEDLTQIAETAARLGISGKEDLLSFSEDIAKTAFATKEAPDEIATNLGRLAFIFKAEMEKPRISVDEFGESMEQSFGGVYQQIDNLGSALMEADRQSSATADQLLNMAGRMAGSGRNLHMTVDELFAIATVLRDKVPISLERSSTNMNRIFTEMQINTDKFIAAFHLPEEFSDLVTTDTLRAVEMLAEGMQKLGETEGPEALTQTIVALVGKTNYLLQTMQGLSGAQDLIRERTGEVNEAFRQNMELNYQVDLALDTQKAKWDGIGEQLDEVQRRGGETLKPLTDDLLELVDVTLANLLHTNQDVSLSFGNLLPDAYWHDFNQFNQSLVTQIDQLDQLQTATIQTSQATSNLIPNSLFPDFDALNEALTEMVRSTCDVNQGIQDIEQSTINLGDTAVSHSVFPEMSAALQDLNLRAQDVTSTMSAMEQSVADLGDTFGRAFSTQSGEIIVGERTYSGIIGDWSKGGEIMKVGVQDILGPLRQLSQAAQEVLLKADSATILKKLGLEYTYLDQAIQVIDDYRTKFFEDLKQTALLNRLQTQLIPSGPSVTFYHSGGLVNGHNDVPAILQAGEYILSRGDVQQIRQGQAAPILTKIQRFHDGGPVSSTVTNAPINIYLSGRVLDRQAFEQFVREIRLELARQERLRI
jgi:TP901 family phage tail tape measure protein